MKSYLRPLPALALIVVTTACQVTEPELLLFEAPSDAAVLPAGTFFDVTSAYVANARSGDIAKLNISDRRYLADGSAGGILRGTVVPTGETRLLETIAVLSHDDLLANPDGSEFVTFFASDAVRQTLVVVPYLDGDIYAGNGVLDGQTCLYGDPANPPLLPKYPICYSHSATFTDEDGQSHPAIPLIRGETALSDAYLTEIGIRDGETTTETWRVEYNADFDRFEIQGSLSGVQEAHAIVGEAYQSDSGALAFTIHISAGQKLEDGDYFEVETSNGIHELDVNGVIQDMAMDAQHGLLYFTTQSDDGGAALYVADALALRSGAVDVLSPAIEFDAGSRAGRLDLVMPVEACEAEGLEAVDYPRLFIADSGDSNLIYQVDLDGVTPEEMQLTYTSYDIGYPTIDLALSRAPCAPTLYLAEKDLPSGESQAYGLVASRVRMLDLQTETEIDPNPYTPYITEAECADEWCPSACTERCEQAAPAGDVNACVSECLDSCSASCETEGIKVNSPIKGMAASLGEVRLNTLDNAGIALADHVIGLTTYAGAFYTIEASRGCLTFALPSGAFSTNSFLYPQDEATFNHSLYSDSETGRTAVGNACGGITRSEDWDVVYDSLIGAWRVRGSKSGEQVGVAIANVRYVSDGGEMSFLILGGSEPPKDGDWIQIRMEDGSAAVVSTEFESLQDLTVYQESRGNTNDEWYQQTVQNGAVMVIRGRDSVTVYDLAPANLVYQPLATYH